MYIYIYIFSLITNYSLNLKNIFFLSEIECNNFMKYSSLKDLIKKRSNITIITTLINLIIRLRKIPHITWFTCDR